MMRRRSRGVPRRPSWWLILLATLCRNCWKWKQGVLASLVVLFVLLNMFWLHLVPAPSHNLLPPLNSHELVVSTDENTGKLQAGAEKSSFGLDDDTNLGVSPPPRPAPTHKACDSDTVKGIYHVAMGDIEGGVGTALIQLVIGQLAYAESQNLKPWVHLIHNSNVVYDSVVHASPNNNKTTSVTGMVGRNATYFHRPDGHYRDKIPGPLDHSQPVVQQTLEFEETGIWEHYFEAVSDYQPGDKSCETKLYVTMDLYLIIPGLHGYDPVRSTRCWRYDYLPEYISQPWMGWTEWIEPQRQRAHEVASKYIRFLPYLQKAAMAANPPCREDASLSDCSILGLHIRHSDKAAGRRVVETSEFLPYCEAFVAAGGQHIYLATDSQAVLEEIASTWPASVTSKIRTPGSDNDEKAGHGFVRSTDTQAVFDMASHHRTNREVLVEILALSFCHFMIHGYSAVSESAFWLHDDQYELHRGSVNLEDPDHLAPEVFEQFVLGRRRGEGLDDLPQPSGSDSFWKTSTVKASSSDAAAASRENSCEGYDGVLWIKAVGPSDAAGAAFFNSILNQLIYADKYNLLPWIHLSSASSNLIFDADYHSGNSPGLFEMMTGLSVSGEEGNELSPGPPVQEGTLTSTRFEPGDSGVWDSYFEPVSGFGIGDSSCRIKPLVTMEESQVSQGLPLHSPWSIRAWRYDGVTEDTWDWSLVAEMRERAAAVVKKYYRFRQHLVDRANEVNPPEGRKCLSVHMRNGDKVGLYRTKVTADDMRPYLEAFLRAGGESIYLATDSLKPLQYMTNNFPVHLVSAIRTQGKHVVRTKKDWPTHMLGEHHRVNSETLVDILALSRCPILLHGQSTVSEAALYVNLAMLSVNMEDPSRTNPEAFEETVRRVLGET